MLHLEHKRLLEALSYDPSTGVFIWLIDPPFGTKRKGRVAGGICGRYYKIKLDNKHYPAHHLAWFYVHKEYPVEYIDHIDGNCFNNRISNLRPATHGENMQNQRKARSNNKTSGLLGVYWHTQSQRWRARIRVNKKSIHLGNFKSAEEAHAAYLAAKKIHHPFSTI